jgi:hypothetical protein
MMRLIRWRTRLRRMLGKYSEPLASSLEPVLGGILILLLVSLVWLGIISRNAQKNTESLVPILQAQATSALSLALLGLAAWAGFQLRYRRARLRYLQPYRRPLRTSSEDHDDASSLALFPTVVDQLLATRPRRSLLVIGDQETDFPDLDLALPIQIACHNLVPVVVDVSDCDISSSIPAIGRENFVSRLAGSTGDEPRAQRLFRREADRGKVIVVVVGLDRVAQAKPPSARRAVVDALLRTSLAERIPFIAAVSDDLAPRISEVAVIRVSRQRGKQSLQGLMQRLLAQRGIYIDDAVVTAVQSALDTDDPTVEPWYLTMAADIILARVRTGQKATVAISDLFAPGNAYRRHLGWMCERALDCGMNEATGCDNSSAQALAAIGTQAHYRQELTTNWNDATFDFDAEQRLRFASGVSQLSRRNVLTLAGDTTDPGLRFSRPEWLSFAGALGLKLDGRRWSELLTPGVPQATVSALTAALMLNGASAYPRDGSFLSVLTQLKQGRVSDISLEMILAVIAALQVDQPLQFGALEIDALRRAWKASTDPTRLLFVSSVNPHPALARFLWEQVVPPQFQANSFRVRRAICARLAATGTIAWHELLSTWADLAAMGRTVDLSAQSRLTKTDWDRYGLPLASACWVLPALAEQLTGREREDAVRLLRDFRRAVTRPARAGQRGGNRVPDVGLEISLAEGFKIASVGNFTRQAMSNQPWRDEALALFDEAESWTSQQVLIQAFALAGIHTPFFRRDQAAAGTGFRHPFVREAAALSWQALNPGAAGPGSLDSAASHGDSRHQMIVRNIWFDDVEALQDGGYGLSEQAHRLLALSTLLINLAEGAFDRAAEMYEKGAVPEPSREVLHELAFGGLAFTSQELPRCFVSARHAATMLDVECDCPFRLCGPKAASGVGHRQISKAFAQRAELTCSSPLALGREHAFVRQSFADVWARPEIARETSS